MEDDDSVVLRKMAAGNGRTIQPVFGSRRSSGNLLDTAEDLVDNLDSLADIITEIEEKYGTPTSKCETDNEKAPMDNTDAINCNDESHSKNESNSAEGEPNSQPSPNGENQMDGENEEMKGAPGQSKPDLFTKLKDGMESAKSLINCLKREKWRLNRREMSVELRMGELEDYKSHLKQDMTSLNDTVDVLSMRVIQLENALCEDQEIQETLQAEKVDLEQKCKAAEGKCHELELHKNELLQELQELRRQRTDSSVRKENIEIKSEIDLLIEENKRLKEMIRKDDPDQLLDDGDLSVAASKETSEDN